MRFQKQNIKGSIGTSWMIEYVIIFGSKNCKIGFVKTDCNQGNALNNGEEDDDIPLYNDKVNISKIILVNHYLFVILLL